MITISNIICSVNTFNFYLMDPISRHSKLMNISASSNTAFIIFIIFNEYFFSNIFGLYIGVVVPLLLAVAFLTLFERKILGAVQRRRGPNMVGIFVYFNLLLMVSN